MHDSIPLLGLTCSISAFKMSKMTSSLSLFVLLIVAIREFQCQSFWEKIRSNYWKPADSMSCYRTVTLQLYENLKNIVDDVIYVERGEEEFKSKLEQLSSSSLKKDDPNVKSQTQKVDEAERVAYQGIFMVRGWLENRCTDEKRNKIKEITKIFKQGVAKCENPKYLDDSIMRLEYACPEKKKEEIADNKPSFTWKSQIHDRWSSKMYP